MKSYAICTLGCKVNMYESESINEKFKSKGYIEKDFKEAADIYVIFTCAVTNVAASKSRKMIHQAIRRNPDALICVVGCYVQVASKLLEEDEHIDILIGSKYKDKILDYIESYEDKKINVVENIDKPIDFEDLGIDTYEHQTRAFLKIQDGCNQFCNYCVIPYARGRERSLNPQRVIEYAKMLSQNHKEIVLAGIHTGRYGKEHNCSLTNLIKMILNECPKLERIRISSIEMTEIDDDLIELMKNDKRVARHFHIPLQAGNDETLKRMNRPYTTKEYLDKLNAIRKEIPGISISTDVICGFIGESEEEFKEALSFIEKCQFSFLHVFPFSLKSGTKAENMKPLIEERVKKDRVHLLTQYSSKCEETFASNYIGKTVDMLCETYNGKFTSGYSSEYIYVNVEQELKCHEIVKVKITGVMNGMAIGSVEE